MRDSSPEEYGKRPTLNMLKRVWEYMTPHKRSFFSAFGLVIVSTFARSVQPRILKEIIDEVFPQGAAGQDDLIFYSLYYLGAILVFVLCFGYATIMMGRVGVYIVNKIKRDLFQHVLKMGFGEIEKVPVGSWVSRIETDSQRLTNFCSQMSLTLLQSFLIILFALYFIYQESVQLFMIAMVGLPIAFMCVAFMFTKLRPRYRKERQLYSEMSGDVGEMVSNVPLVQNMNRVTWAEERVKNRNLTFMEYIYKIFFTQYGMLAGLNIMEALMVAASLILGVPSVVKGELEAGTLVMFIRYILWISQPVMQLSEQLAQMQRAGGAADRIFTTLDTPMSVPDVVNPRGDIPRGGALRFENVSFSYVPDTPIIKNFSLSVEPGQTVALVGKTGCGKSTLLNLLLRLRDVTEGQVTYGGINIKEFAAKDYRLRFGMVLQDLHLFPTSVATNMRVFRDTVSDEQIEKALTLTEAKDLVESFEQGLNTVLDEGGKNLSYGERQLLSFSRALAVDPEILLLDEATSSVDPGTELKIQQMLDTLTEGRTTVVVAHRLSTIRKADKIVLMHEGEILEEGRHDELMAQKGRYYDYVTLQQGQN